MVMEYEEDVFVDILDEGPPVDKGKENVESGEFDRWDGGGSVSGGDDSDHFYSRYRNDGGDYGGSRGYKVRSVVESRHQGEDKGGSLSSKYRRVAESDEEEFSKMHVKRESGDKERKRNYRRRNVVDGDSSYEEDEEKFTTKLDMHDSEDKKHERNYMRRRVVDDDYTDEESEEEELVVGKRIFHGSGDKEHSRNYRHRRVVDGDYSDDKAKEEQLTRKLVIRGSGDKEHERIYRHRRVVDVDYSDDEVEEQQITSKLIICDSGNKQHSINSKRRRVTDDDYIDNNFEFAAKRSKERYESGSQDWQKEKILSRRHSRSRDEKMSEDRVEKDRDRSRKRDDSHERKRDHQHVKHSKHDRYDEEDKYKGRLKDIRGSVRYSCENDDEDGEWGRERLGKERDYDHKKERGRSAMEEKYDSRRDMHRSARYQSEHDDDYDREMAILDRKRHYVYSKEERDDEEDKYNRRLRGVHHISRYQTEHDDKDWEGEIMETESCSWERGREMNANSNEMKREKDHYFRGRDKESLGRTSLIEREKEEDAWQKSGDIWEEGQEMCGHVKGRMGKREINSEIGDLRILITEAKEKSHRRELEDGEKERDSVERQSHGFGMSVKREFEERKKERDFRGRDREHLEKSKEIQRNNGGWKLNFSDSTVNKREREPSGKICEKEKIHKVIRKKDLAERDITSMEDSHKRKWDKEMGGIISKRDFSGKDSRKQDTENQLHVIKETDSEDYNTRSREMSQETEWDRKTRQRYQKREYMGRDRREREGRQYILGRDGVCQLHENLPKKQDKEKREDHQERGLGKEGRETTRRDFAGRDTGKPDIEIKEKSLEMELMQKENERDFMTGNAKKEKSHHKEHQNNAEETIRGEGDNMSYNKILENVCKDNENRRDIMIWDMDMEKSQQNEILNNVGDKSRRGVKISHANKLEHYYVDKENDRNSELRSGLCRENCTKTIQGEIVRELFEEEKCRYETSCVDIRG